MVKITITSGRKKIELKKPRCSTHNKVKLYKVFLAVYACVCCHDENVFMCVIKAAFFPLPDAAENIFKVRYSSTYFLIRVIRRQRQRDLCEFQAG